MNLEDVCSVLVAPIVSEKGTMVSQDRCFVFRVRKEAAKRQIKRAVEMMFAVKVVSVDTANVKGKSKRTRGRLGKRPDWKKAYVTLASGYEIDLSIG